MLLPHIIVCMGVKHKVNENFFKKWSKNMAYVLGYIYADGNLLNCDYIRARYFQITSVELDALERIKHMMNSEHNITKHKPSYLKGKIIYRLKIGSHEIYNDLLMHGLYPNKSLDMEFPEIPLEYTGHFIRGYFDGDGCIYFEKSKNVHGDFIIRRIRTIFTSGSKLFFDKMKLVIEAAGIQGGKIYKSKRSFQLVLNTEDSIKIFKIMYKNTGYNSFFMRKFLVFNDYFKKRPIKIDSEIRKILDFHNTGLVVKKLTRQSAKLLYEGANPSQASL